MSKIENNIILSANYFYYTVITRHREQAAVSAPFYAVDFELVLQHSNDMPILIPYFSSVVTGGGCEEVGGRLPGYMIN